MIRVSKEEEDTRTVVTVDGQISADCIQLVETCCNQAMAAAKSVCCSYATCLLLTGPAMPCSGD